MLELSADQLSGQSDFFALGGHSLLLTQLASRIRKELGVEISLASLYSTPVLSEMAILAEQASPAKYATIPIITPRPDHIPLSYAQQRIWFIDSILKSEQRAQYNISFAMRWNDLDVQSLCTALDVLVERHEQLRATFKFDEESE